MNTLPPRGSVSPPATAPDYPLKLDPVFVERVWGREDLSFLYSSRPAEPRRVGEVWLTGDSNRVSNGPCAGDSVGELVHGWGNALVGPTATPRPIATRRSFPLLIKFLFTTDKLSVQVHPPDAYARQREGSRGKTEMWYVLKAEPGASLAVGFREDVQAQSRWDREALADAVASGAIEEMLDWREVQEGDTFFVPAGMIHAIGPGLALCEIQQNSDITYRLFDYHRPGMDGRPRTLHVDKALDVLEWSTTGGRTAPLELQVGAQAALCLAACPHFATEKFLLNSEYQGRTQGRAEIWIGLGSQARFTAGGEEVFCGKGEVILLPASTGDFSLHPLAPATFLRTYTPDLEIHVLQPLRAQGYSEQQISRVCFPPQAASVGRKE